MFKNFLILIALFLGKTSWATDTYDKNTGILTIPYVAVDNILYANVRITVKEVINIGLTDLLKTVEYDLYDKKNNTLIIKKVNSDNVIFNNVLIKVGNILSVGDPCVDGINSCLEKLSIWEKYSWIRPTNSAEVSSLATLQFQNYITKKRTPLASFKVVAQTGVDITFINWVQQGGDLVVKSFSYPNPSKPLLAIVAIERSFYEQTLLFNNFSSQSVGGLLSAWDGGAPAWGGVDINSYNYNLIIKNLSFPEGRSGMAQTPGHESFHTIQELNAGANPGPKGEKIPNWFWEGPAMFVGLQTSNYLGFSDYILIGRNTQVIRCMTANMRKAKLSEVAANVPNVMDPYGIGAIATELLVANLGMEKFMNIYTQLKNTNLNFPIAFYNATAVTLDDFYLMFEDVRGRLGCAKI